MRLWGRDATRAVLFLGIVGAIGLAACGGSEEPVCPEDAVTVRVQTPSEGVGPEGTFAVDLLAENVANLGGFQFTLNYDPSILHAEEVSEGPFLASTGREVLCRDPEIGDGAAGLVCVTLGAEPAGPDGSGVMATVTFTALASGDTDLELEDVKLVEPAGDVIESCSAGGSLTVGD